MFDDSSSYFDVLNSSLVNDNAEWTSTDHVPTNGGHPGSSIVQSGQDIEIAHSTMVIEASGAVTLSQVDNGYFLYATGTTTGPQLKYDGAAVSAGQFGLGWTPIGVEASAGGYQVVWKADGDPYTTWYAIWNVDGDGNFTSNDHGWLTADRWPLESLELPFGQNLNGDGTLGPTTAVIEAVNATTLMQVADTYFLYATGTTTGPQLKYDGDAAWVGQFGLGWTPIGVEASAVGYQVVWKASSDPHTTWYAIWNVDSDGNFTSNDHGWLTAARWPLEALELPFGQNLNGDGTLGPTTAVIEAVNSTTLMQVADTYFLYAMGTTTGPQLKYDGDAVSVGQFGLGWTPIGVEASAGGYQVVWKADGDPHMTWYAIWNVDSDGNFTSNDHGWLTADRWPLESLELPFGQNLNGDGTLGLTTAVIEAVNATTLTQVADTYFLYATGTTTGPQLKYDGDAAWVGQFGLGWTPIGVEVSAGGYQVVWKADGDPHMTWYAIWSVDSDGNFTSNDHGWLTAGRWPLESLELPFGQNLNGDGTLGLTTAVIEAVNATTLTQVADTYFLYATGTTTGPQLKYNGAAVSAGQFGLGWTPIGVEASAGGYQVVWRSASDLYAIWNVDSDGNFTSNNHGWLTSISYTLEALETAFSQDLNRDGVMGLSTAFIEGFGDVRLAQVADRYFFYPYPGLSGPQFNYLGAPVTVGQFGGWTPIAVEWAGAGYQVAWRLIGVDNQYRVWDTDVLGNYVRYSLGPVSGSDRILQQAETNFRQDLNGDGFVGLPPRYDINIDYSGDPALRPYFDAAARRWEEIIKGDLPGFDVPGYGFVDDLLISASVTSIDGPGRVLAEAGPDWVRVSGRLPIHGVMRFDSADVMTAINNGSFQDVVLHEMGHVLGIGSLWAAFGLKNGAGSAYFGQYGLEAYHQLGGTGSFVPLETAGGPGTAGMHWSEAVFGNELMTGFISGPNNPLSRMTIGGLRDLGYSVDYGGATPYGIPPWALDGQGGVSSVAADLITTVEQGASRSDAVVDTSEAWWGLPRRFSLDVVFATEDEDENVWPIRTHGAS